MRRAEGEPTFLVGFKGNKTKKYISISFTSTLGLPESERGNKKGKKKGGSKRSVLEIAVFTYTCVLKRSFWEIAVF